MNNETDNFESRLTKLEKIVGDLEQGGMPLQDSIHLFEQGQQLLKSCRKELDEAQVRIQQILEDGTLREIDPESVGKKPG